MRSLTRMIPVLALAALVATGSAACSGGGGSLVCLSGQVLVDGACVPGGDAGPTDTASGDTAPPPDTTGLPVAAGASAITFWAWGGSGGEVVTFLAGYPSDGFERSTGEVTLEATPTEYAIPLGGTTWDTLAGGFAWVAASATPVTLFIDDIEMEGPATGAGCTDGDASNFDPAAQSDDGSCV